MWLPINILQEGCLFDTWKFKHSYTGKASFKSMSRWQQKGREMYIVQEEGWADRKLSHVQQSIQIDR